MRKALVAIAVVVVLAIGAAVFLYSSLDGIVKTAIVDIGGKLTGTKVSVAAVHIALAEGKGSVGGFELANPAGFSANAAIRVGEVDIAIDKASVTGNPIVIKELVVKAPAIRYELGAGGSNLEQLKKKVAAHQGAGGASSGGASSRKLVIDRLLITKGEVTVAAQGLPGATASLGDIELKGIGRGQGGVDEAELGQKLLGAILDGAIHSAVNLPGVLGQAGEQLKSLLPIPK
jgi:uncharacterized protein involved in outer membrane biogenesis